LLSMPPALAQGDPQAGLIYFVRGTWLSSEAGAPLRATDKVSPGERILPGTQPKAGDQISISLFDGTQVTLRCTGGDRCDAPYSVPDTRPRAPSLIERMGRVLEHLGAADVDRVITPAVRGAGPQDAVVLEADGKLDLGPALSEVGPGRYQAQLRPWTDAGPGGDRRSLRVIVQASGGVVTAGDAGAAGLYELALVDDTGALAGQAIILIASAADFDRLRRGFERVRSMTASWRQSAGAAAVRQFLQYYLLALGRDPGLATETP
jgi:hypothetical protein